MNSFFFLQKNFLLFFYHFDQKNYTQKNSFKMYVSQTHLHEFLFLLEIFRQFLCVWYPKLKKHKKWNISLNFQRNLLIFCVKVVLGHHNMCAKFQLFKRIFRRIMKFWNIQKIWSRMIFRLKILFQKKNPANFHFLI